jgi:hypothetical protein
MSADTLAEHTRTSSDQLSTVQNLSLRVHD